MAFIGPWEIALVVAIIIPIVIATLIPTLRKALGLVLVIVGILLSLTLIGALFGIPLMFIGAILLFIGSRQKETFRETTYVPQPTPISDKIRIRYPHCKALNDEHARFCSNCGKSL